MAFNITLSLSAKPREVFGRKVGDLRKQGFLPAVVYGQKIKNLSLILNSKEFEKVFEMAGEHSLIGLKVEGQKEELPVLIHDIQKDSLSGQMIHIDFYKPNLEKKVKAWVPLRIEGESGAVKNLGGTLIKNISELEVRALPMSLPHELVVDVSTLNKLGSEFFVKNLQLPEGVEVLKDPQEVIVSVVAPQKVEEELEKPIEEKVEEVEAVKVKREEGEEEVGAGEGEPEEKKKEKKKKE